MKNKGTWIVFALIAIPFLYLCYLNDVRRACDRGDASICQSNTQP